MPSVISGCSRLWRRLSVALLLSAALAGCSPSDDADPVAFPDFKGNIFQGMKDFFGISLSIRFQRMPEPFQQSGSECVIEELDESPFPEPHVPFAAGNRVVFVQMFNLYGCIHFISDIAEGKPLKNIRVLNTNAVATPDRKDPPAPVRY